MTAEATKLDAQRATAQRLRSAGSGIDTVAHEPLTAEMVIEGPLPVRRMAGARLAPALAFVLGGDLAASAQPDAVHLAVDGAFLALELRDGDDGGALVVSERLLPLPLDGSLRLYLGGSLAQEVPLDALGSPTERLAWLAARVDGLRAGDMVLLGPAESHEARPGAVEVWGPLGSTVTTTLSEDVS